MIDTKEKARKKVLDTWNANELFIILSESKYSNGRSVPRAFQIGEGNISLGIFTNYKAAEEFCRTGYIVDGRYLIGRIDNRDKYRDLYSILNTALHLGINRTDIDCGTEDAMNITLAAMMDWGGREISGVSMLLSKDEFEQVNKGGEVYLHFNSMPLYNE